MDEQDVASDMDLPPTAILGEAAIGLGVRRPRFGVGEDPASPLL